MAIVSRRHQSLKLLLIISLAFNIGFAATVASHAFADRDAPEKRMPPRGHGRFYDKLNLTKEQREQVDSSRKDVFNRMHQRKEELREKAAELVALISEDNPDCDAIRMKIDEISAIRGGMQMGIIEHFIGVRQTLREDQLDEFRSMVERSVMHFGKGRGGMPGKGPRNRDMNADHGRRRRNSGGG